MENTEIIKIIYEDDNLLAVDKPAGMIVFPEGNIKGETLIDLLVKKYPAFKNAGEKPRYGVVHRIDKDTSGIILIAKNNKTLKFLQTQFKERKIKKKYLLLVIGNIERKEGKIKNLIGRSLRNKKQQKVYLPYEPKTTGKREAITYYKVLKRFQNYDLVEAEPKTGRKHQIRVHFSYLGHPIAGDKTYGYKNQPCPKELSRQFLHASCIEIKLPDGKTKELKSKLPEDLRKALKTLNS